MCICSVATAHLSECGWMSEARTSTAPVSASCAAANKHHHTLTRAVGAMHTSTCSRCDAVQVAQTSKEEKAAAVCRRRRRLHSTRSNCECCVHGSVIIATRRMCTSQSAMHTTHLGCLAAHPRCPSFYATPSAPASDARSCTGHTAHPSACLCTSLCTQAHVHCMCSCGA